MSISLDGDIDLLSSGSGKTFFGAQPYLGTPSSTTSQNEGVVRKKKPPRKPKPVTPSRRTRSPGRLRKPKELHISSPLQTSTYVKSDSHEHPEMLANRAVAEYMARGGVRMIQLRTIRQDGTKLVVQKRNCRLIKRASDDFRIRLLRDDDTIVETMWCSQIQRVVLGAKTPTLERAIDYAASTTPDVYAKAHKWQELHETVVEMRCITIIYGNQYLDFQVIDHSTNALALGQYLLWVTVLASMNTSNPLPEDDPGGHPNDASRSGLFYKIMHNGSFGSGEAITTSAACFSQAQEYGELEGAPIEKVSVVCDGFTTKSIPGMAPEFAGMLTCHGTEMARSSNPDNTIAPKGNQDAACCIWPFRNDSRSAFIGIFDGHGDSGHRVSHFCARRIAEHLEKDGKASSSVLDDPAQALTRAYECANGLLAERHPAWAEAGGTTAVGIFFMGKKMWIANCGDSRAVIGRLRASGGSLIDHYGSYEAKDLSIDQTPDVLAERKRIIEAGGWIGKEDGSSDSRVWLNDSMTSSGLSMTRSLGDLDFKVAGVTATPVVTQYELQGRDKFIICASDGIWSVLSSAQAVDIVAGVTRRHPDGQLHCSRSAQELMTTAARKWKEEEGDYRDDISVVVVRLPFVSTNMSETKLRGNRNPTDINEHGNDYAKHGTDKARKQAEEADEETKIKEKIRRRIEKRKAQAAQMLEREKAEKQKGDPSLAERKLNAT